MFKRLIVSHAFRRRVSWIVAGVLILPFAIFFHATGQAPIKGPGGDAGIVFGRRIPWEIFQEQHAWHRRQWENQLNGDVPEALEPMLKQLTWDRVIQLEEAKRAGLRVDDRELAAFISKKIPAFQESGRFDPQRYRWYLRATNMSPQTFEQFVRNDLLLDQLVNGIREAVTVSDEEVRAADAAAHEQLQASLFLFDPASFADQVAAAVIEDQVRAFYEAHPDDVRIPEQIAFEYAGSLQEELAARVQLSNDELEGFYRDHADLLANADGTTKAFDEVKDAIRQQLTSERVQKQLTALQLDLQEDLEAKLRFEEIAMTRALPLHTAGPLPVGNPWVAGEPEPAVLQAAAGVAEGQMSEVIRTENGVYLVRMTRRLPARVPPFDEVRSTVKNRLIAQRTRELAKAQADEFRTRLNEQLASGVRFEEALLIRGGSPARPVSFTRSGPMDLIGSVPAVNEASFAAPLGTITEVLETPVGFVIVRPEVLLSADGSTSAEEAEMLRQETLTKKQSARVNEWLSELRERAKLQSFVDLPPS